MLQTKSLRYDSNDKRYAATNLNRSPLVLSKIFASLLLLSFGVLAQPPATHGAKSCRDRPDLVGRCFAVHGRLSVYNGNPTIRLWRIGTNRLLGVRDPEEVNGVAGPPTIPATIREKLDFDKNVYGDFLVCPLTRSKPGRMQIICIESGKNLIISERK